MTVGRKLGCLATAKTTGDDILVWTEWSGKVKAREVALLPCIVQGKFRDVKSFAKQGPSQRGRRFAQMERMEREGPGRLILLKAEFRGSAEALRESLDKAVHAEGPGGQGPWEKVQ